MNAEEGPSSIAVRLLLLSGVAAAAVLATAVIVAGQLEPGYSHARQMVSELGAVGATHPRWFGWGGLTASGLLTLLFAAGLRRRTPPEALFAASAALVAVAGIGRALAGVFPCDAGCSVTQMSLPARIHAVGGLVALGCGVAAPLFYAVAARRRRAEGDLVRLSFALGLASAALFFLLLALRGPGGPWVGLVQRLLLAAFYSWVVLAAVRLGTRPAGARLDPRAAAESSGRE